LWWVFQDRVSWTICPGWLWIPILWISLSWVAKITRVSHWHPAFSPYFFVTNFQSPFPGQIVSNCACVSWRCMLLLSHYRQCGCVTFLGLP
jgi:hypothetical protein